MIHSITLPGEKGEIYKEILSSLGIFFVTSGAQISAKFSSENEAQTVWSLFVEKFNQIIGI